MEVWPLLCQGGSLTGCKIRPEPKSDRMNTVMWRSWEKVSLAEKIAGPKTLKLKTRKRISGRLECCEQRQKIYETMMWKHRHWPGNRGSAAVEVWTRF